MQNYSAIKQDQKQFTTFTPLIRCREENNLVVQQKDQASKIRVLYNESQFTVAQLDL